MVELTAQERSAWSEPGAIEVAPGVYRVPLPLPGDGLKAVNVYVLVHGARLTLIDAGWGGVPETRDGLVEALAGLGFELSQIDRVLATHAHRDHYTFAASLRADFGTSISIGEHERENIEQARELGRQGLLDRLVLAGAGELLTRSPGSSRNGGWEAPDTWLKSGDILEFEEGPAPRRLEVVATPGHTRGHVVYVDAEGGALFSGDHILPHITPSVGYEPVPLASPLSAYLESLAVARQLGDLRLLPAHGPVTPSSRLRIDELLQHHEERLAHSLALVGELSTAREVAGALPWTRHDHPFASLDALNQMLAINETLAHLDVLVERSLLTRTVVDGVAIFAPEGAPL